MNVFGPDDDLMVKNTEIYQIFCLIFEMKRITEIKVPPLFWFPGTGICYYRSKEQGRAGCASFWFTYGFTMTCLHFWERIRLERLFSAAVKGDVFLYH